MNSQTRAALDTTNRFAGSAAINIREAVVDDNEGLLALTRVTPMAGRISLRIDRDPDFFALLRARGKAIVYVATFEGKVIGCMSAAIHTSYISGTAEQIAHVGDLKVHPRFSGAGVALRLIAAIGARLRLEGIDLCMSLIADGNSRAMRLTDGKYGTPAAVLQGRFIVDQLIPTPLPKFRTDDYEARRNDLPGIEKMVRSVFCERNFATPVVLADLERRLNTSESEAFSSILVVRDAGRVVATLTVEDTQSMRQNVLIGLPIPLRVAFGVLRASSCLIPRVNIPRVGQPLAVLYVRFMACAEGYHAALRQLIAVARVQAFRRKFTFLSVGLHEWDPLRSAILGIPRFTFTTRAMVTSLITPNRAKSLVDRVPYEDFALV